MLGWLRDEDVGTSFGYDHMETFPTLLAKWMAIVAQTDGALPWEG